MRQYTSQFAQKGMTLIELLISLGIAMVIAGLIAITFATAQESVSVGLAVSRTYDAAQLIEQAIREDIKDLAADAPIVIKTQTIQNPDTNQMFEIDQIVFFKRGQFKSWQKVSNNADAPHIIAPAASVWYGHTLKKGYTASNQILWDESSGEPTGDPDNPAKLEQTMNLGRHQTLLAYGTSSTFSYTNSNVLDLLNSWGDETKRQSESRRSVQTFMNKDIVGINLDRLKSATESLGAPITDHNGFNAYDDQVRAFSRFPQYLKNLVSRRYASTAFDSDFNEFTQKKIVDNLLAANISRFKIEFWNDSNPEFPFWQRPVDRPNAWGAARIQNNNYAVQNGHSFFTLLGMSQHTQNMIISDRPDDDTMSTYMFRGLHQIYDAPRVVVPKMLRFTITIHDENSRLSEMHHETKVRSDDLTQVLPGHTSDGRTVQFIVHLPKAVSKVGSGEREYTLEPKTP